VISTTCSGHFLIDTKENVMEWLVPWYAVADDPAQMAGMAAELARESSSEHPLYGLPVRTLGRRQDCDDVLFAIEDGTGRVAVVHLTWTYHPPETPPWPGTAIFANMEDWVPRGMRPDHEEFCH
jgi:hypothetical protein